MRYIVIGKEGCSFCTRAKEELNNRELRFDYVDLADNPATLEWLKEKGCRTVPQILFEDEGGGTTHIGGYTQLVEFLNDQN